MDKTREFWIDETTQWFHEEYPEWLTKEPHQHKITHVIEYSEYEQLEKDKASNDYDYLKLSAENNKLKEQNAILIEALKRNKDICEICDGAFCIVEESEEALKKVGVEG